MLDEFALLYFFGSPSPQEQLSTQTLDLNSWCSEGGGVGRYEHNFQ